MTETRAVYNTGEHKGQLILCQEGQRLFDEYVQVTETNAHVGHISEVVKELYANKAWHKYQEHRKGCKECRYD